MSQCICSAPPAGTPNSGVKAFLWLLALIIYTLLIYIKIPPYFNLMYAVIIPPTEELHHASQSASVSVQLQGNQVVYMGG